MLEPLIPEPKNAKQRKAARVRQAMADAAYIEVQRIGSVIQCIDGIRAYFLEEQLRLAHALAMAGVPMEGVVRREDAGK